MLNDFVLYFLGALHTVAEVNGMPIDHRYDYDLTVVVLSSLLITSCALIVIIVYAICCNFYKK